jgi:hypothetical protein
MDQNHKEKTNDEEKVLNYHDYVSEHTEYSSYDELLPPNQETNRIKNHYCNLIIKKKIKEKRKKEKNNDN